MARHIIEQLEKRGIEINVTVLANLANRCDGDVALLLHEFDYIVNDSDKPFRERTESNGDLVYLIVRNRYPVTVMFRRSAQVNTPQMLKVSHITDIRDIIQNYVIKENKNEF